MLSGQRWIGAAVGYLSLPSLCSCCSLALSSRPSSAVGIRSWSSVTPPQALVYADPNTFTGADPNPKFDADDELVFMAGDTGGPAGFGPPQGVLPGSMQGLAVVDRLGGPLRYVYLFVSDGSLKPGAGKDYVQYQFNLLSGDYKTTYNVNSGTGNPESSVASCPGIQSWWGFLSSSNTCLLIRVPIRQT